MTQPFGAAGRSLARSLRDHWKLFLFEGVVLVVLGIAALLLPLIAGLAVAILFGWLFLVLGIVGMFTTYSMRYAPGFVWSLLSAILTVALGVGLLIFPGLGLISLTYVLIAFFIAEGAVTILYALEHKRELTQRWGWMLLSGVVDLVVALIILLGLPGSFAWALGLIVGINLLFGGASMVAMALAAREVPAA